MDNTSDGIKYFRWFFSQKILPAVYDDSLSYYEILTKVIEKLNEVIKYANLSAEEWQKIYDKIDEYNQASQDRDDTLQGNIDKLSNTIEDYKDNLQKQITSNDKDIEELKTFDKEFYNEYSLFVDDINLRFKNIASLMMCYDPTTGRYTDSANAMRRMFQYFVNTDVAYTCNYINTNHTVTSFANAGTCGTIFNKDFQYNTEKMPLQEVDGHSVYDLSQLTLQELDVDELALKPEVLTKKPRSQTLTFGKLLVRLLKQGISVVKE